MADKAPYHYHVIRRAIEVIDGADTPLSLSDLAARMDMSPAHFQRLFSAWVGVSPKRYQQYLTLDHAKFLLRERFTTFETAQSIGLSGTSRLHDLFLRWEAMAPGVYAQGGAGLTICYGWFDSPFGDSLVMGTDRGVCGIGFVSETTREGAMADLQSRWPKAQYCNGAQALQPWVDALYTRRGTAPLHFMGSPLQIKVWEALMNIPSGYVTSYSEIARYINAPKAVRAVGTAVGRNPISWFVPCHRALRKSGVLGGYHWGLPVKRALLAWEGAQVDSG